MRWTREGLGAILNLRLVKYANPDHYCEFFDDLLNRSTETIMSCDTGGCNSFTRQSLLSAETDPFRLDSQFEFSRTYSHQYDLTVEATRGKL